jgi:hypothetical protein
MPTSIDFKYHAFLSYAHADVYWGKWLHNQLESFRISRAETRLQMQPFPHSINLPR